MSYNVSMNPPQSLLNKLEEYEPNDAAKRVVASVPIVLIVGISGAGKDTVCNELLKLGHYHDIITHTTRKPRINHGVMEQNGVAYHFIDFETAEHMLDNHGYIEAKKYANNIYGTSVAEFQLAHDEQKIALADIEVQGVAEFYKLSPMTVHPIFLLPPSYEEWSARLLSRYSDPTIHKDDLWLRKQDAQRELAHFLETNYYSAIINDDLEQTVESIDAIARGDRQSQADKSEALSVAKDILEHLSVELGTH